MMKFLPHLIALFLLTSWPSLEAQEIWPGDINNNGVVNNVDFLFLGHAFGTQGPGREEGYNNYAWGAHPAPPPWDPSFPGGLNFSYADCDGNGSIDYDDYWAVKTNYGNIHGNQGSDPESNGQLGLAPPLFFIPVITPLIEGTPVILDLHLGTPDQTVQDFYGISFSITYDPEVWFEGAFFGFFTDGWILGDPLNTGEYIENFEVDPQEGRVDVVVSRTNGTPIGDGSGSIGTFFIVIEDIAVGLNEDQIQTSIRLENVLLIDENMAIRQVYADTLELTIQDNDLINNTSEPLEQKIQIHPNPCDQELWVKANGLDLDTVVLYDLAGRRVYSNSPRQSWHQIQTSNFSEGYYMLELSTSQGRLTQQIIIQHP